MNSGGSDINSEKEALWILLLQNFRAQLYWIPKRVLSSKNEQHQLYPPIRIEPYIGLTYLGLLCSEQCKKKLHERYKNSKITNKTKIEDAMCF